MCTLKDHRNLFTGQLEAPLSSTNLTLDLDLTQNNARREREKDGELKKAPHMCWAMGN